MIRPWVRQSALWGGLTALGVGLGFFAVPVSVSGTPGGVPYGDHKCTFNDCSTLHTLIGGRCGWCTGDLITKEFWKCTPDAGSSCEEDDSVYGSTTCDGACELDEYKACSHSYNHCQ